MSHRRLKTVINAWGSVNDLRSFTASLWTQVNLFFIVLKNFACSETDLWMKAHHANDIVECTREWRKVGRHLPAEEGQPVLISEHAFAIEPSIFFAKTSFRTHSIKYDCAWGTKSQKKTAFLLGIVGVFFWDSLRYVKISRQNSECIWLIENSFHFQKKSWEQVEFLGQNPGLYFMRQGPTEMAVTGQALASRPFRTNPNFLFGQILILGKFEA